jgi:lipoyl(octanoyl) transferase
VQLRVINVLWLGRVDYQTGLDLQQTVVHLVKEGRIGHTLLLLEHPPVITLGRNASEANIVAPRDFLANKGVELFETNRGGDVTFHGPGQLVGYPIFNLRAFEPRIGAVDFVRKLEEVLIRTCGDLGVFTERIPGLTGVWTQAEQAVQEEPGAEQKTSAVSQKKLAAIGVHISRAVTSHGFALNVNTDLDYFKLIVPCGITDKPVTSLAVEMPLSAEHRSSVPRAVPTLEESAQMAARNFGRVFEAQTLWLESLDALLQAVPDENNAVLASAPPESVEENAPANQDTPARAPEAVRQLAGDEDIYLA